MEAGGNEIRSSSRETKGKPPPKYGNSVSVTQRKQTGAVPKNSSDSVLETSIVSNKEALPPSKIVSNMEKSKSTTSSNSKSKSVQSTSTHQSSSNTIKIKEIRLLAKREIFELDDQEVDWQMRSGRMLEDIQKTREDIEAKKKAHQEYPSEDPTISKTRQREIEMLEDELRGQRNQFAKFKIELESTFQSIQRKKELINEKAKLDEDKINLEEEEAESQKISDDEDDEDAAKKTGEWVFKSGIELTDNEISEMEQKTLDEEAALQREAQETAKIDQEELAALEAEEARQLKEWEKSQLAIRAKRQQIESKVKATEATKLVAQAKTSVFPTTNSTEELMQKFFHMQIKMMDQGTAARPTSSSTFLARQSHAKELPYFGGRPEEWPTFEAEFERSTRDCGFSNSENMSRLRKCLKGEAYKTVQCLMVAPENLTKVLKTLKNRFGQPEHIIEAMIEKAKSVPAIREDRLDTLIEFGTAVQNVTMTITALKRDEHLNNPQLLRELETKLPVQLQMNWMRWVSADITRKNSLTFFSEWLEQETVYACKLCRPKLEKEDKRKESDQYQTGRRGQKGTVLATANVEENKSRRYENSQKDSWKPKEKTCAFCSKIGHRVAQCKDFEKQDLNNRWKLIKDKKLCFACLIFGHDLKACRTKRTCGIEGCNQLHHRLLHKQQQRDNGQKEAEQEQNKPNSSAGSDTGTVTHAVNVDQDFQNCHILPVRLQGPNGILHTFAMMDNGSNITLIKSSIADQLGLKGPIRPLRFQGLHPIAEEIKSRSVELNIMPATGKEVFGMSNVRTINELPLPTQSIGWKSINKWKHLNGLGIKAYSKAQPEILIGNDHLRIMVVREVREGPPNAPVAVRTNLGWTILTQGDIPDRSHHAFLCHQKDDLHQLVKDYYSTESFGVKITAEQPRSKEDKRAQSIMDLTMKRVGEDKNRWETGLLWKADDVELPESKSNALNRLKTMERKLDRNPKYAAQYYEKMHHYFERGYARKLSSEEAAIEGPRTWYLPHFGTSKPSKPEKIRLVFDAAAKSHGICLNDVLLKGVDQVNPLPSVLYKFRQRSIGITGDIREMFHQVNIIEKDQDSLRFLWRGTDREKVPDVYQMQVMVFGAACSPACAQEAKNRNAKDNSAAFPAAANAIIYKHFVDDYLDSLDTEEEANQIIQNVVQVHLKAGFEIVNFISNSKEVMDKLPEKLRAAEPKVIDPDTNKMERVLGLNWDPISDQFTFTTNFHRVDKDVISGKRIPTKREALSLIMSIYDPLGFLAHFTIKARIQLQETWRSEVGWDDKIPDNTHEKWLKWIEELQKISSFRLARCYDEQFSSSKSIQLHVLCDASEQAFAAVAYYRIETSSGVKVAFVSAKAKVAPLKTLCMPRMELQAAVLGTRLANSIKEQHEIKPTETHYWTDSEVAYCWVRSDGKKCPQFVSHRIGEIQESTDAKEWHWIPTKLNVADEATRDNCPTHWKPDSRWVKGPEFLLQQESEWPKKSSAEIFKAVDNTQLEFKKEFVGLIHTQEPVINISNYSSWNRLRRITAWMFRFIENSQVKEKAQRKNSNSLSYQELTKAERCLWRQSQQESFTDDIKRLTKQSELSKTSQLLTLDPYLDKYGILKVKGRLHAAKNVPDNIKNPVILEPKNALTRLIIKNYHEQAGHHGQERVVNELRQVYCIPNIRNAVKSAWNHCQLCKNHRAVPVNPQMGLLPECRLQSYVRPFTVTGLDYFGPMEVTVGRRHEKRYGALFTCLTSRAVHVEIVSSLTTDSCIMAIRRFTARRGNPLKLYSDNGTNFKGADNELRAALQEIDQDKVTNNLSNSGIEWHFIPPAAPHMGGCWERLVKSVKVALKSTLKERYPKEELLHTLMAEAEHVVNSRPLTHVSYDPSDQEALTPNHFLLGCSSNMQPPGKFSERDLCIRTQWRAAEALTNQFWKRWVKEYLPTLTRRTKWHRNTKEIEVGDIVLIADNNMTRNSWPMGKVVKVYPGRDGVVRVVDVIAANKSIYNRPVAKICVLDVRKVDENPGVSSSGGNMSSSRADRLN